MRKLTITTTITNNNNNGDNDDEEEGEDEEYQEEQWEEANRVAFVTSASEEGDIVLWDVKSKQVLQRVAGAHDGVCFWVDVHGETGTMVSCGQDGRIVVFRHRDPEEEEEAEAEVVSPKVNGSRRSKKHKMTTTTRYPEEEEEEEEESSEGRGGAGAGAGAGSILDVDVSMREDDEVVTTNGHSYLEAAVDGADVAVLPRNEGDIAMED